MSRESFPLSLPRRALLLGAAAAAVAALPACAAGPNPPARAHPRLRLIGEARLPHRFQFRGTTVGGLSGLDYDPASAIWYALSDDGSDINPARFYTLRIALHPDRMDAPEFLDMVTLRQADGTPYPGRTQGGDVPDPEALRFRPQSRSLLWSSEGDVRRGLSPFVRETALDGKHLREFSLPGMFKAGVAGMGPRHNLAFEGLALTADGLSAWVAMEGPLQQDGPVPAVGRAGGPCRFTQFDIASGRAVRQIAYLPDAIPQAPVPSIAFADNGVSEILMLDAYRMLVLERAYMMGVGNSLRLYLIDTRAGSDTLAIPSLQASTFKPAPKTLLLDFSSTGLTQLDNTEAMAWGPRLPNGHRTLVFASDDNFNPRQVTQFVAFEFPEEE